MDKLGRLVPAFAVLVLLSVSATGCALRESGAVHMRKTVKSASQGGAQYDLVGVFNSEDKRAVAIKKDEYISIRLKKVFVKQIPEIGVGSRNLLLRGEVAIVSQVFEEGVNNSAYKFKADGLNAFKLIYFSNDVLVGQPLNFTNLPMYTGQYTGNPLGFQLALIEVDTKEAWVSALMNVIADAGKNVAPGSAAVVGLVNNAAQAILKANTDDIMFKYDFSDMPRLDDGNPDYPLFQAGDYVFVRKQDRTKDVDWDSLDYRSAEGRLYNKNGTPFTDETYMVVSVLKSTNPLTPYTHESTYAQLVESIKNTNAEVADELKKPLDALFRVGESIDTYKSIESKLNSLLSIRSENTQIRRQWATSAVMELRNAILRKDACAGLLGGTSTGSPGSAKGCLSQNQIDQLVRKLSVVVQGVNPAGSTCNKLYTEDEIKTATNLVDCLCPAK